MTMRGSPGINPSSTPAITSRIDGAVSRRRAITATAASTANRRSRTWTLDVIGFPSAQITLPAVFTMSAISVVSKMKETMPCDTTSRRIPFEVMATSETWKVIPITNEK